MTKIHQCDRMAFAEAWIENEQNEWLLNINRVATEQDLEENNYLETLGQTIDSIEVNILYCPYCGEQLNKNQAKISPSFQYKDSSKW